MRGYIRLKCALSLSRHTLLSKKLDDMLILREISSWLVSDPWHNSGGQETWNPITGRYLTLAIIEIYSPLQTANQMLGVNYLLWGVTPQYGSDSPSYGTGIKYLIQWQEIYLDPGVGSSWLGWCTCLLLTEFCSSLDLTVSGLYVRGWWWLVHLLVPVGQQLSDPLQTSGGQPTTIELFNVNLQTAIVCRFMCSPLQTTNPDVGVNTDSQIVSSKLRLTS